MSSWVSFVATTVGYSPNQLKWNPEPCQNPYQIHWDINSKLFHEVSRPKYMKLNLAEIWWAVQYKKQSTELGQKSGDKTPNREDLGRVGLKVMVFSVQSIRSVFVKLVISSFLNSGDCHQKHWLVKVTDLLITLSIHKAANRSRNSLNLTSRYMYG